MTEPLDADVSRRITLIAADGDIAADQVREFLESLGIEPIGWQQVSSWTGQSAPSGLDVLNVALNRTAGVVAVTGWGGPDAGTAALAGLAVGALAPSSPNRLAVLSPAPEVERRFGRQSSQITAQVDAALWGASGFRLSDDVEVRRALIARLRAMGCVINDAEDGSSWRTTGDFSGSWLESQSAPSVSNSEPTPSDSAALNLAHVDFDVSYTKRASLLKRNAITIAHHASEPLLDVSIVGRGLAMRDVQFLGSPIAQFPPNIAVPFNLDPDPGKVATIALRIIARTQDGRMVIHDADIAR